MLSWRWPTLDLVFFLRYKSEGPWRWQWTADRIWRCGSSLDTAGLMVTKPWQLSTTWPLLQYSLVARLIATAAFTSGSAINYTDMYVCHPPPISGIVLKNCTQDVSDSWNVVSTDLLLLKKFLYCLFVYSVFSSDVLIQYMPSFLW